MASPKTRRTASAQKSSAAKKSSASKTHSAKKVVARPKSAPKATKKSVKKGSTAKKAAPQMARAKKPARPKSSGFGRVRVPVDARLDLVFQKDYQAREVFDFLKVQSIRELEQFGPDEIIDRLTGPMQQTVLRIRKTLALVNRHLAKDEKFAQEFLREVSPSSLKRHSSRN